MLNSKYLFANYTIIGAYEILLDLLEPIIKENQRLASIRSARSDGYSKNSKNKDAFPSTDRQVLESDEENKGTISMDIVMLVLKRILILLFQLLVKCEKFKKKQMRKSSTNLKSTPAEKRDENRTENESNEKDNNVEDWVGINKVFPPTQFVEALVYDIKIIEKLTMLVNSVVDLHEYIDIVDVSINMIVYLTNINVYISKADNRYDEPVSIGQVKIKQLIAQHQQDAFALDFMSSVKTWGRVFYDASNISSSVWKKLKRVTCSCSTSCSDGICRRVGDGWSWELDTLDSE